jgi:hypothetical protein
MGLSSMVPPHSQTPASTRQQVEFAAVIPIVTADTSSVRERTRILPVDNQVVIVLNAGRSIQAPKVLAEGIM